MFYTPDTTVTPDLIEAIQFYMNQYFIFLQTSGNHVLFDLSDFDDNKYRPKSEYALIHNESLNSILTSFGGETKILGLVDGSLLSKFYDMLWLTAVNIREQRWATLELCLASICSEWIAGAQYNEQFFINFHAPSVKILCRQEVILTFNIKELGFWKVPGINERSVLLL